MLPRLVELRIRGLRTLADVTLPLGGLTVLIGDNGTGKSSILEALRIASLVVEPNFVEVLSREHMIGPAIRKDTDGLELDLRVESADANVAYSLKLDPRGRSINHESICALPADADLNAATSTPPLVHREPQRLMIRGADTPGPINTTLSMFEYFGRNPPVSEAKAIREALEGIDIHLPFRVNAAWANRSLGQGALLREPQVLQPSSRLELFGANLANAYHTLKNSGSNRWRDTLELLRLGLGPGLEDVLLPVAGGGHLDLALELRGRGNVPAFQLADGELTYLAFVALVQLDSDRTLLSFDEPEQHLHPSLLGRVLQLFEDASARYPVILATHSDRLLDFLPDPAAVVRVCELDDAYRTRLRQLDEDQLGKWMQRYSGLGEIRAAGQLRSVMASNEDSAA